MAISMFEELMTQNRSLNESVRIRPRKTAKVENRKFKFNRIKVESRRIFEEEEFDELEKEFDVPEEDSEDDIVLVIDPEIGSVEEVPEEAAEEAVGDLVYKCPVCGANYLCDHEAIENEAIEVDEDGVPIECPICGDDADQILVGEIAPVEDAGEETEMDSVEPDEGEEEEEIPEEDEEVEDEFSEEEETEEESVKVEGKDNKKCPKCGKEKCECDKVMKEDFEEDEVADDFELTPEIPVEEVSDEIEEDEEPEVAIDTQTVEIHFEDKKFENLMNKFLKDNYKNRSLFKVENVTLNRKTKVLTIEYVVRQKGASKRGKMVAENFDFKTLRFKDKGVFTEAFTRKPIFEFKLAKMSKRIVPTAMKYDFKKRVNESLYRIYGSHRISSK